ncbi:hypothetical protein F4805DRAFT_14294 [Annulohypoxylon moriforme]|nr:hypothetical protein F4805DRAFT_14294 [Annulohypoxylon moriforme]
MKPNVSANVGPPPRMGGPSWNRSASEWSHSTFGPSHQPITPMFWHQPPQRGVTQPITGPMPPPGFNNGQDQPNNAHAIPTSWLSVGEDPLHGPTKISHKPDAVEKKPSPPNEYKPTLDKPLAYGRTAEGNGRNWERRSSSNSSKARRPSFTNLAPTEFDQRYTSHQFQAPPRPLSPTMEQPQVNPGHRIKGTRYKSFRIVHPDRPCVNERQFNAFEQREEKFDPCPCARCVERDCSIYIDNFGKRIDDDCADRVVDYFARSFGPVQRAWTIRGSHAMIVV